MLKIHLSAKHAIHLNFNKRLRVYDVSTNEWLRQTDRSPILGKASSLEYFQHRSSVISYHSGFTLLSQIFNDNIYGEIAACLSQRCVVLVSTPVVDRLHQNTKYAHWVPKNTNLLLLRDFFPCLKVYLM